MYIQKIYCIFANINSNNIVFNLIHFKAMAYYRSQRPTNGRGRANYGARRNDYRANVQAPVQTSEKPALRYPGLPMFVQNLDAHLVRLIRIVHANGDIRRYTALGIIKAFKADGTITGESNYVRFRWDKFTICSEGINNDYRYTDTRFLTAFVAAFSILSGVAEKALNNFCKIESDNLASAQIEQTKVDELTKSIVEHQLDLDENIGNFDENEQ